MGRALTAVLHGIRAEVVQVDGQESGPGTALAAAVARSVNADVPGLLLFAGVDDAGRLTPVRGVTPVVLAARDADLCVIVAPVNGPEAASVLGADVRLANTVDDVLRFLAGDRTLPRPDPPHADIVDPPDLPGTPATRRAIEIAAAGGHGLLVISTDLDAASRVTRALRSLLPPLEPVEAEEATCVASVAGLLAGGRGTVLTPPFRSAYRTISSAELVGGTRPGEVSLAHAGVLVLRDLPEFRRTHLDDLACVLAVGQAPVGDGYAPARAQIAATMRPCPCGRGADPRCTCQPTTIARYIARVDGPLVDLFDVRLHLSAGRLRPPLGYGTKRAEAARARVAQVRERQRERGSLNAHAIPGDLTSDAEALLRTLPQKEMTPVRRVARTVADLRGGAVMRASDVQMAMAFRVAVKGPQLPP